MVSAAHSGEEYQPDWQKGGVLADGLVSVIASAVGSLRH